MTTVRARVHVSRVRALTLLVAALACTPRDDEGTPATATVADTTALDVTRPTVIAYLTLAPGAVDSQPDVAVLADDWAYGMSILGDSVQARGWAFAMWTEPRVAVRRGARVDRIALGEAGYVLVMPTGDACVGRGAMEPDSLLAAAARWFGAPQATDAPGVRACTLPATPSTRPR